MSTCEVIYTGSTPGADSDTYNLFNTTVAAPMKGFFQLSGTKRFVLDLAHDKACTLNASWSNDRGTTWFQYSSEALGVPAANTTRTRDYLVEQYPDWKLDLVNGGSAQTGSTFAVIMALSEQRPSAV